MGYSAASYEERPLNNTGVPHRCRVVQEAALLALTLKFVFLFEMVGLPCVCLCPFPTHTHTHTLQFSEISCQTALMSGPFQEALWYCGDKILR